MTLEKARSLVKDVAFARRRWGRQTSPPYTVTQLMEALELLDDAGVLDVDTAEVTRLKRQLGAAKSREMRLRKQLAAAGAHVTEDAGDEQDCDAAPGSETEG